MSKSSKSPQIIDYFQQLTSIVNEADIEAADRKDILNDIEDVQRQYVRVYQAFSMPSTNKAILDGAIESMKESWEVCKSDLVSGVQNPERTSFISHVHMALMHAASRIESILINPPKTPQFQANGVKLSRELLKDFIKILNNYRALFVHLLEEDSINSLLINNARNPLKCFKDQLKKKYSIFFFVDGPDMPSESFLKLDNHLQRTLEFTQELTVKESTKTQLPHIIRHIDKTINAIDVKKSFEGTPGEKLLKIFSKIRSDTVSIVSTVRDRKRENAPWFKPPMFKRWDDATKKAVDQEKMLAIRDNDFSHVDEEGNTKASFGERDVILQKIKVKEAQLRTIRNRISHEKKELEALSQESQDPIADANELLQYYVNAIAKQKEESNSEYSRQLDITTSLIAKHENIIKAINQGRAEKKEIEQKIALVNAKISKIETDLLPISQQMIELQNDYKGRQARVDRHQQKLDNIREEIDRMQTEMKEMTMNEERFKKEAEERMHFLSEEISRLEPQEQELSDRYEEIRQKYSRIKRKIPEMQFQIQKTCEEICYRKEEARRTERQKNILVFQAAAKQLDQLPLPIQ